MVSPPLSTDLNITESVCNSMRRQKQVKQLSFPRTIEADKYVEKLHTNRQLGDEKLITPNI